MAHSLSSRTGTRTKVLRTASMMLGASLLTGVGASSASAASPDRMAPFPAAPRSPAGGELISFEQHNIWQEDVSGISPYRIDNPLINGKGVRDEALTRGVFGYQRLLNTRGFNLTTDGVFGAKTKAAIRQFQLDNRAVVKTPDGQLGILDFNTSFLLMEPLVREAAARHGVSDITMLCVARGESAFDIAAVGPDNSSSAGANTDVGWAQYNSKAHEVTRAEVTNPWWSTDAMAEDLRSAEDGFDSHESAVLNHHSPVLARKLDANRAAGLPEDQVWPVKANHKRKDGTYETEATPVYERKAFTYTKAITDCEANYPTMGNFYR